MRVVKSSAKIDYYTPIASRTRSKHSEEKDQKKKMDITDDGACLVEMNDILSKECCVCLEHADEKKDIRMKCCAQIMHKSCFLEWTSNKVVNMNKCLVCKGEFESMLEYTSFEDVLKYADEKASVGSHRIKENLQLLGYALTQAFQLKNINIYIKDKVNNVDREQSDDDNDWHLRRSRSDDEPRNWEGRSDRHILMSRLFSFVISVIIIALLLISIFSQSPNCTAN